MRWRVKIMRWRAKIMRWQVKIMRGAFVVVSRQWSDPRIVQVCDRLRRTQRAIHGSPRFTTGCDVGAIHESFGLKRKGDVRFGNHREVRTDGDDQDLGRLAWASLYLASISLRTSYVTTDMVRARCAAGSGETGSFLALAASILATSRSMARLNS